MIIFFSYFIYIFIFKSDYSNQEYNQTNNILLPFNY